MITILFHMTVKPGHEEHAETLAREMTASTRAQDDGCITYAFYRQSTEPRQLVLFEQWRDQEALNAHMARLQSVLGPPDDQEPYPPAHHRRRLPKRLLDLFEQTDARRYDALI